MAKNPKTNKSKRNPRKIINSIIVVFLCLILVGSVSGFFILSKIVAKVQLTDEELVAKIEIVCEELHITLQQKAVD